MKRGVMLAAILALCGTLAFSGCTRGQTDSSQAGANNVQAAAQAAQPNASDFDPPKDAPPAPRVDAKRAFQYVREVVDIGPRPIGSTGHQTLENYLRSKLKGVDVEEDAFTAQTPAGAFPMRNFIAKFPGKKDGVVVIAGHYDTNLPLKNYVGANDGGSSTGILLEFADVLRASQRDGYSVWLVWVDGEEATVKWTATDSLYGSRHLAERWQNDGTAKKVKAFILLDMIGDADLNIDRDQNSTPWLTEVVGRAAQKLGYHSHFFKRETAMDDDHRPFANVGIPVIDLIDFDYGFNNIFHHTSEDKLDKLSPQSLEIVGNTVLETLRMLDSR
ncbi:MAG TPA: M28 family peptidase [Clostridia bacterium]|nr:M28 family peptidase [Clostridia bacterium]